MDRRSSPRADIQRTGVLKVSGGQSVPTVCRAVVVDQSGAGLCVSIQLPLPPQTEIALRLDEGEYVLGCVRYCRRVGDAEYVIGIASEPSSDSVERRTEPRYPVKLMASLTVLPSGVAKPNGFHCYAVEVLNISAHGVGLICSDAVTSGTSVLLELRQSEMYGIVRYCTLTGLERYWLGVAVTEVLVRPRNTAGDVLMAVFAEESPPPLLSGLSEAAQSVWTSTIRKWRAIHNMLPTSESAYASSALGGPAPRCRQFPAEGNCMLGDKWFGEFNCSVCGLLERWRSIGVSSILVQEIQNCQSFCLIPQRSPESPPGPFIMEISFRTSTIAEVRSAVQSVIESAAQTWIEEPDRCIRIK